MAYKLAELDAVVEHFLGIMLEDSLQGLGSPLVETMQQASMFAMQDKWEQPPQDRSHNSRQSPSKCSGELRAPC
eukprot:3643651-Karenia_brevis.AAC.1